MTEPRRSGLRQPLPEEAEEVAAEDRVEALAVVAAPPQGIDEVGVAVRPFEALDRGVGGHPRRQQPADDRLAAGRAIDLADEVRAEPHMLDTEELDRVVHVVDDALEALGADGDGETHDPEHAAAFGEGLKLLVRQVAWVVVDAAAA